MKTYLMLASAALALSACSKKTDTTVVQPTATDTAMATPMATSTAAGAATGNMAGTYEVTMTDGKKMTETINADGTYTDGMETKGTWRMEG